MRLIVVSPDIPYPANRGGRADIWRRIQAFTALGVEVFLIFYFDDRTREAPEAADMAEIRKHVRQVEYLPIDRSLGAALGRLAKTGSLPWHVACRTPNRAQLDQLTAMAKSFNPDAIWCEGPWVAQVARPLRAALGKPMLYRSHNIEHVYMLGQSRVTRNPRKRLALRVSCIGLERYERACLADAHRFFDISSDDLNFWSRLGHNNGRWLPPLAEVGVGTYQPAPTDGDTRHDVVFLGNMTTPNNIQGVRWLVQDIVPAVLASRPGTTFLIAGSNPGPDIHAMCAKHPEVTLLPNPVDAQSLLRHGRVLVNPVQTGSGVHLKSIDMLMTDAPIVSCVQGTRGLPDEVRAQFRIADDTASFAAAIVEELDRPSVDRTARQAGRTWFTLDGIRTVLEQEIAPAMNPA